jgi:hypothetical protein
MGERESHHIPSLNTPLDGLCALVLNGCDVICFNPRL